MKLNERITADNNYKDISGNIRYDLLVQKYVEFKTYIERSILGLSEEFAVDVNRHVVANNINLLATPKFEEQLKLINTDESYTILKIDFKNINSIVQQLAISTIWNEYTNVNDNVERRVFQKEVEFINDFLEINIFDKTIAVNNDIVQRINDALKRIKIVMEDNLVRLKDSLIIINKDFEDLAFERDECVKDIDDLKYGKYLNSFFNRILERKLNKVTDKIKVLDRDISKTKSGISNFENKLLLIECLMIFFSSSSLKDIINKFKSRLESVYGLGFIVERAI